jgi:hypothetical protein
MTEFFDKLRTDRKLDECLKLANLISDPVVGGRLQALLALHFAEIKIDLPLFQSLVATPLAIKAAEAAEEGHSADETKAIPTTAILSREPSTVAGE